MPWVALRVDDDVRVWDAITCRRTSVFKKQTGETLRGKRYAHTLSTTDRFDISFGLANPWEHAGRNDDDFIRDFCAHPNPQIGFPLASHIQSDTVLTAITWTPVTWEGGDEPIDYVDGNKNIRIAKLTLFRA